MPEIRTRQGTVKSGSGNEEPTSVQRSGAQRREVNPQGFTVPCWTYCENKSVSHDSQCSVTDCESSNISTETDGADTVYVYEDSPIVVGFFLDLNDQPRYAKWSYDYQWNNYDGDMITDGSYEDSSRYDAGSGRQYNYWFFYFWLEPDDVFYGDKIEFEASIENLETNNDLAVSTKTSEIPAKIEERKDASISSVDWGDTNLY